MARASIILAAGQGTRMKSATPKVMHAVAGLPILGHVIAAVRAAGAERIVVVSAPGMEDLRRYVGAQGAENAIQDKPLGTGHAALAARTVLGDFAGALLINNGDMPLAQPAMMADSLASAEKTGLSLVAFRPRDPAAYGRVLSNPDGTLDRIVEFKDATPAERAVDLCCAGTYSFADAREFFAWAAELKNDNAQKEYYLPEVPRIAKAAGVPCAITLTDEITVMGVNSRAELADAEQQMQRRLRARALAAGVGMTAPETVFLAYDTVLEPDVHIGPYVVFGPGVTVKSGAQIKSHSHLEGSAKDGPVLVGPGALVGPYARLRGGAVLEDDVHIGNFVEVKNTRVEKGAKANHLTYLGDARVGAGANIGAGTITCNYDGFDKHYTDIGAGAFIGSNSALVAPVTIAGGVYVGAGSVITKTMTPDSLAVTRAEQKEIPGWAEKFRTRKRAEKAAKAKGK